MGPAPEWPDVKVENAGIPTRNQVAIATSGRLVPCGLMPRGKRGRIWGLIGRPAAHPQGRYEIRGLSAILHPMIDRDLAPRLTAAAQS